MHANVSALRTYYYKSHFISGRKETNYVITAKHGLVHSGVLSPAESVQYKQWLHECLEIWGMRRTSHFLDTCDLCTVIHRKWMCSSFLHFMEHLASTLASTSSKYSEMTPILTFTRLLSFLINKMLDLLKVFCIWLCWKCKTTVQWRKCLKTKGI